MTMGIYSALAIVPAMAEDKPADPCYQGFECMFNYIYGHSSSSRITSIILCSHGCIMRGALPILLGVGSFEPRTVKIAC